MTLDVTLLYLAGISSLDSGTVNVEIY